jgi:hypothetical protein
MGHRAEIENIFVWLGLGFYAVNYITGWLLHFKLIRMTRMMHKILFAGILIILALVTYFQQFFSPEFILVFSSLVALFALPFGRKGGNYHIITGSIGIVLYIIFILIYVKLF